MSFKEKGLRNRGPFEPTLILLLAAVPVLVVIRVALVGVVVAV
jgi:hypothetical protein